MIWNDAPKFEPENKKTNTNRITPDDLAKSGTEHGSQAALFLWSADNVDKYPALEFMFAIPNGFYGDSGQKGKMKAEGLRSGVCDVFLPYINPWNNGLFIEMKIEKHRNKKDGGCSAEQIKFINYTRSAGYYVKVCYNWMEARDTIVDYLEGRL